MKTSLPHTLQRIAEFGSYSLDDLAELLSPEQLAECSANRNKTGWSKMTHGVFLQFLNSVRTQYLHLRLAIFVGN